eukprot:5361085-Amphidinium_carterae.1
MIFSPAGLIGPDRARNGSPGAPIAAASGASTHTHTHVWLKKHTTTPLAIAEGISTSGTRNTPRHQISVRRLGNLNIGVQFSENSPCTPCVAPRYSPYSSASRAEGCLTYVVKVVSHIIHVEGHKYQYSYGSMGYHTNDWPEFFVCMVRFMLPIPSRFNTSAELTFQA